MERLDDRLVLTAGGNLNDALPLSFHPTTPDLQVAQVSDYLSATDGARLFRIDLDSPQTVSVQVDTSRYGGAFDNYLRVFQVDAAGDWQQIASNDNWRGRDAGLSFEASGVVYIGVSGFDNADYDPTQPQVGGGSGFGLFDLQLESVAAAQMAMPIVAVTSVQQSSAEWGQAVTVQYTLENRGEFDSGPLTLLLLASANSRFDDPLPPLGAIEVVNVAAGSSVSGSFEVSLGADGVPVDPFQASQIVYFGVQVGDSKPLAPATGNDWDSVQYVASESVTDDEANADFASARLLAPDSITSTIDFPAGDEDYFQIILTQNGVLSVSIEEAGGGVSLTLYDGDGNQIVHSDGVSHDSPGPLIMHRLLSEPGGAAYFLKVSHSDENEAAYRITTRFSPSDSELYTVDTGSQIRSQGPGDFNGDGIVDVVTLGVGANIWLGNGDGTFRQSASLFDGLAMHTQAVGDFNDDGRLDLVVSAAGASGMRLFLGNGDGAFADAITLGDGGNLLAAGDFNGDGKLDLVRADVDFYADSITVFMGDGSGAFSAGEPIVFDGRHLSIAVKDFNGDGFSDVALGGAGEVTLLLADGAGSLQSAGNFAVPLAAVTFLITGDWNGDFKADVAAAGDNDMVVALLLGDGAGSLQTATPLTLTGTVTAMTTADFNGDGHIDIAATTKTGVLTVFLGTTGDGFRTAPRPAVVGASTQLTAADMDGDGQVDLAVAEFGNRFVMLKGRGDGTFPRYPSDMRTGTLPQALASGDFDGDGFLDLASANAAGDVSVFLGNGDSTFRYVGSLDVGDHPNRLIAGDFNGDGRLDLVVANYLSLNVSVLLGDGHGGFQQQVQYEVSGYPTGLVAGDFDEDSNLDLAVALGFTADGAIGNTIALMRGKGNGEFENAETVNTGWWPKDLIAGDFDDDGHLDLATANFYYYYGQDVTVLRGDGTGQFDAPVSIAEGGFPSRLVSGDFDGDGDLDFAEVNAYPSSLVILRNDGDMLYTATETHNLGTRITALVPGDFNDDGILDLAVVSDVNQYYYSPADNVRVLLGNGDGTFTAGSVSSTGSGPVAVLSGDFNNDGRADLATANQNDATITTLVGDGAGDFASAQIATGAIQSTPLLVRFAPGGTLDAVVLTETGSILLRRGTANIPGAFDAPIVVNPQPAWAARDVAIVKQASGTAVIAAIDARTSSGSGTPVSSICLYAPNSGGGFDRTISLQLPAGVLPTRIYAADLDGDGRDDLVIVTSVSNQVFVALQRASGQFDEPVGYSVGVNPCAVEFARVNDDDLPDLIVVDRYSGQISLLGSAGGGAFLPEVSYRADLGAYDLVTPQGSAMVASLAASSGIVSGEFDAQPGADLIVIHSGTGRITQLSGTGGGGFFNPTEITTAGLATPTAIVAGDFVGNDDLLDLAVLCSDAGTVSIYRGEPSGGFTLHFVASAGNSATGLSVADVTGPNGGGPDGLLDLLVGNTYGDLLVLAGQSDGTLATYRRATPSVALAVAVSADGAAATFFFSDQANDQLSQRTVAVGTQSVEQAVAFDDRDSGVYAPGSQQIVTVENTRYLVVANSGANEILIYTLDANNHPIASGKQTYFAGTSPAGFAVTNATNDLNQDTVPDLVVANQGSNDVSVFLGEMVGDKWTLTYRPRQSSGGIGPSTIVIADVTGVSGAGAPDGVPDVIVGNTQSGAVEILPNRGDGFLINQPDALPILQGIAPRSLLVGNFDGVGSLDLVALSPNSNSVTLVQNFAVAPVVFTFGDGAAFSVAAIAGDIDRDGISDLLIANADDGSVQSLLGGANGFVFGETLHVDALALISDLAFVHAGDRLDLYGADASREIAYLIGSFGPSPLEVPHFFPAGPGVTEGFEILTVGLAAVQFNSATFASRLLLVASLNQSNAPESDSENGASDSVDSAMDVMPPLGFGEDAGEQAASDRTTSADSSGNPEDILLLNVDPPGEGKPLKSDGPVIDDAKSVSIFDLSCLWKDAIDAKLWRASSEHPLDALDRAMWAECEARHQFYTTPASNTDARKPLVRVEWPESQEIENNDATRSVTESRLAEKSVHVARPEHVGSSLPHLSTQVLLFFLALFLQPWTTRRLQRTYPSQRRGSGVLRLCRVLMLGGFLALIQLRKSSCESRPRVDGIPRDELRLS